jgi:hypothetical protein
VCETCGRATQEARGRTVAISATVVETAMCDAQVLAEDGPAAQRIPPATRRRVMRRDHGRCQAPGCRLSTFVDVHHIQLRSEGGSAEEENLIVLCQAHHAAIHEGRLLLEGRAGEGVRFLRADGASYGAATTPSAADVFADVFAALRRLGCREGEARAAVDRVRPHVGQDEPAEEVLRRCLKALRELSRN